MTAEVEVDLASPRRGWLRLLTEERTLSLLVTNFVLIALMSLCYSETFFTTGNFSAVFRNLAYDAIVAVGMTLVLISGGIDLSVGAVMSLAGVLTGYALKFWGWPVMPAIGLGLVAAAVAGLANGLVITRMGVNPFIATLATMGGLRGVSVLISGPGINYLPKSFSDLGEAKPLLHLPLQVWVMIAIVAVFSILLAHSRFFRKYFYIGGNEKAARLSGIRVDSLKVVAYVISAVLAGVAGVLFAARMGAAQSTVGDGSELKAITAVVLGGASLAGGQGSVLGAFLGTVFMAFASNALVIGQVSTYWQSIVIAAILLAAVAGDVYLRRKVT